MTRTEERLTDALAARAAAVAPSSIRPLHALGTRRVHRRAMTHRWSASLTPLAAAASVAAIAGLIAMLPHHQHHGPASPPVRLPQGSALLGVAAASAASVWAVGFTEVGSIIRPLIMHWNGRAWARSPAPAPRDSAALWAAAPVSARDAWAVGSAENPRHVLQPYILRWNGRVWRQVPAPMQTSPTRLKAVAVVSAGDVWAVGSSDGALILHWNGVRWQQVRNPWQPGKEELFDVVARSASDVWVAGTDGSRSLIARWNGTTWTRFGGPSYARLGTVIRGITIVSPELAWAVGEGAQGRSVIVRWDGRTWHPMRLPSTTFGAALTNVAAVSATQAWAVGSEDNRVLEQTGILRWQGHAWQRVLSPKGGAIGDLFGIVAVSADDVWAVGYRHLGHAGNAIGIILHWNGTGWRVAA